ncbi:MAG: ABC transporter substrate-binding protein [Candidatus Limnocylindria bacterium]
MSGGGANRFLTTVLMTDMVDSTALAAELGDRGWRDLVQLHNALVREALRRHDGREMDTAGDGFFAIFDAPGSAILCALEIVGGTPAIGVQVRAGVHVGEVEQMGAKVGGITVVIAARISSAAGPGEVLVSTTVRDLAAGAGIMFEDRGIQVLKGVPGEWRMYAASQRGAEADDAPSVPSTDLAGRRMAAIRLSQARPLWQRHPRAASAVAAGLAVIVMVGGVLAGSPWRPQAIAAVPANALGIIDLERNEIVGEVRVGQQPTAIAHGEGGVWVANSIDATVQRIDPARQLVVHTVDVGLAPIDLVVADGSVWVANSGERSVSRINVETGRLVQTITVGNSPSAIAAGAGGIWVTNRGDGTVMLLDAASGEPLETIPVGLAPSGLAVDDSGVWVISEETGTLAHLDLATGWLSTPIAVGPRPIAVDIGAGSVWIASATDGTVTRVDPDTRSVTGVFATGGSPSDVVVHADDIWIADRDGFVHRLDASDPEARTLSIAAVSGASAMAPVDDAMWFAAVASTATHSGGTLRVAGALGLPFNEPGISPLSHQLWSLMGDGLVTYPRLSGASGAQLIPGLAESMPSITDGGLTYGFRLRSGVLYSNGQPVRAEDFRNAIERLFQIEHPYFGGPLDEYTVAFGSLRGAEACIDAPVRRCDLSEGIVTDAAAGTITFHLSAPDPYFLFALVGQHPIPADAAPPNTAATDPVPGTGPYMVAERDESQMRLVRNPHFESWSLADRPDGLVDEIILLAAPNLQEATEMVARGDADWVHPAMQAEQIPSLRTQFPSRLHFNPSGTTIMFMDTTRPPFNSLQARQAVNLALDRARLAKLRGGVFAATPTCQTLPPVSVGYQPYCPWTDDPNAGGQWSAPDLQTARRLVDESGTRGTRVGVGPMPPRFNAEVAPYLVSVLEELGYDVTLETVETDVEANVAVFTDQRAQVSVWSASGGFSPSDFFGSFTCDGSAALSNYCDPELDARIEAARDAEASDPAAAAEAYAAIDREITDLALGAPLLNEGTTFVSSRVRDVQHHFLWSLLLDRVWLD